MMMNPADLLRKIVSIPSFSGREAAVADFVQGYLEEERLAVRRIGNNLLARVPCGRGGAPTLMLNSHLDTVRPAAGYTFDPFDPPRDGEVVRGLGSNDAGGAVVAMVAAALHFHRVGGLEYDLLLLLSAEEEVSGAGGISLALRHAGRIDCAVIGEPTRMMAAVAERGLLVLDGLAEGVGGHAARGEGVNAIYRALDDIAVLRGFRFGRTSPLMGDVKLTVTQIEAGTQHNVVPDRCRFVVDIRPNDRYSNREILDMLQAAVHSRLTPRTLANRCSRTPPGHPLEVCAAGLGVETYVSPTTSDWVRLGDIPAVKMGPGDSARSHAPDEYITVAELEAGVRGNITFLEHLKLT